MSRSFNGTSSFGQTADSTSLRPTSITVSAWFKCAATPSGLETVLCKPYGATWASPFVSVMLRVVNNTSFNYGLGNGSSYNGFNATVPAIGTTWHHVALTYNGTTCTAYMDGSSVGTDNTISGNIGYTNTAWLFGKDGSTVFDYFSGSLGPIAIWNTPLSANEVLALAKGCSPLRIRSANRIAYWPLDGVYSPEPDYSGGAHNITLTSATAATNPPVEPDFGIGLPVPFIGGDATAFSISPSSALAGSGSPVSFTCTPNGSLSANESISFSDGGVGGTFSPTSLSFLSGSSAGQSFTWTSPVGFSGFATITGAVSPALGSNPTAHVTVALPTITLSPTFVPTDQANVSIAITGTNTTWTTNAPTFTISGVGGVSKVSQSVASDTSATLVINTGPLNGVATVKETSVGESATLIVGTASLAKAAQLGASFAGLIGTLGYTLYKSDGTVLTSRTTSGISEIPTNSGSYVALVSLPWNFQGAIVWDTGGASPTYAADEINAQAVASLGANGLDQVIIELGITAGASLIDDAGNQLTSINARQALSLIQAALAAVLSGASGSTINIKPAALPSSNNRITATVDASGDRSSISLRVPE